MMTEDAARAAILDSLEEHRTVLESLAATAMAALRGELEIPDEHTHVIHFCLVFTMAAMNARQSGVEGMRELGRKNAERLNQAVMDKLLEEP